MKRLGVFVISLAILSVALVYMFCYQVRYDQVAVITWFDEATEHSVQDEAGLKLRMPWPINKVTHYSRRIELVEDKLEELQTADKKTIIARTFLAWRIEDPLKFFVTLEEVDEANRQLTARLREIRGIISEYRFDQIVNADADQIKLAEIEQRAKEALARSVAEDELGVSIERVGIYHVVLPEAATDTVFETMIQMRERLAEAARREGQAQAQVIQDRAERARDRILQLAEARAQELRAEGDRNAAVHYDAFAEDEEFAIFLRKIDTLRSILAHNTTFVLDANSLNMLQWLDRGPDMAGTPAAEGEQPEPASEPVSRR